MNKQTYISNAFSLSMLSDVDSIVKTREISAEGAAQIFEDRAGDVISAVGHESTAAVISQLLERKIAVNRINVKLNAGDQLIVFQLTERLPEGKILTEEELGKLNYKFVLVSVLHADYFAELQKKQQAYIQELVEKVRAFENADSEDTPSPWSSRDD